jgi:membrane-bound lytic murein transglycosylase D
MLRRYRYFLFPLLVVLVASLPTLIVRSTPKPPPLEQPKPEIPLRTTEQILNDIDNRVSDEFTIPEALKPRVSFWFDIYTKYGFEHRVIHHSDYPWWVIEVVDVSDILEAPSRALWLNHERAEKEASKRLKFHREAFRKLALKVKKHQDLNDEESQMLEKVQELPGSLRTNLAKLSSRLRIQTGQKDFFTDGLKKSTKYLDFMEKIFENQGLPRQLTRLPLVESSFNLEAGSKVGALGIWQLMPNVSRKFIMVSDRIDERKSPYKSTYVAAWLFKENVKILKGSWPLVVTAYNHGPGGMRAATKKLNTDDFSVIIEKHKSKSFGFASENFYCSFLAALHAQSYAKEIFGGDLGGDLAHVEYMQIPRNMKIRQLAGLSQLSQEDFLSYNPDLKKAFKANTLLPRGFIIFLPSDQINIVKEGLTKSMKVAQR